MKIFPFFVVFTTSIVSFAQNQEKMDSLSYSVGVLMAENLKQQGLDRIEIESLSNAMNDVFENRSLKIDVSAANAILQTHFKEKSQAQFKTIIEEGKKFLEENAKNEHVVVLESGLQYTILKEGTGNRPTATDNVTTHYHGTLLDGTIFDSSVNRGQPASFPVNGVIKGWQEALQLMPVGSKWKLFVPYDLAYGERGAGADIKPYSTLIFEVELLSID